MYGKLVLSFCVRASFSFTLSVGNTFDTHPLNQTTNVAQLNVNGKECSEAHQCSQHSSFMVCNNGTCECPLGYFSVHRNFSIDCVKKNLEFGETCSFDFQCQAGLRCINEQCICPRTSSLNKKWKNSSLWDYTSQCVYCSNTNFCQVFSRFAFCSKHLCNCIKGFVKEQIITHQTVINIKCIKENACSLTSHCKSLETSKTFCVCDKSTQECKCSDIAEDTEENFANIKHIVLKITLSCIVIIIFLGVTITSYRYRHKLSIFCYGLKARLQDVPRRLRNREHSASFPTRPEREIRHISPTFNSPSAPPAEFNLTPTVELGPPSYEEIMAPNKNVKEIPPPNYKNIQ